MLSQASTSQISHSAEGHLAFLRRVTADDQFRAQLEADPQAAMAAFGLQLDSDQIPSTILIPSSESILDILIDAEDGTDAEDRAANRWYGFLGAS